MLGRVLGACDAEPFILSFPPGEPAKVDWPIDECRFSKIKVTPQQVEIVNDPLPGSPGQKRVWTVAGGFKNVGEVAFKPDTGLGRDALRR